MSDEVPMDVTTPCGEGSNTNTASWTHPPKVPLQKSATPTSDGVDVDTPNHNLWIIANIGFGEQREVSHV